MQHKLTWKQLIFFTLFYFIIVFIIGVLISLILDIKGKSDLITGYKFLILDGLIFAFALLVFKDARKFIFQSFNLSAMKKKRTYLYISLGFIVFFVSQIIFISILNLDSAENQNSDIGLGAVDSKLQILLLFLSVALITPIKEEMLYRGLLAKFIEQKYNFPLALIVSSLTFGLLHSGYPFSATVMGITFVVLNRLTGSIIPSITLHILWNFYVSVVLTIIYL